MNLPVFALGNLKESFIWRRLRPEWGRAIALFLSSESLTPVHERTSSDRATVGTLRTLASNLELKVH